MVPGCEGKADAVTDNVLATLVPQLLPAVTVTDPDADPATKVMLLEVEVPVHPPGFVQV